MNSNLLSMVEYHQEQSMQDQLIQYFVHIIDNKYIQLIHQIHLLDFLKLKIHVF